MGVRARKIASVILRIIAPIDRSCLRCHIPFRFTKPHILYYSNDPSGSGCSALCEDCSCELIYPMARMKYYRRLWESWQKKSGPCVSWKKIWDAVLNERITMPRPPVPGHRRRYA